MYHLLPAKYWIVLLWAILVGVSLAVRPLFPIDETRYATVAWEMWLRHDFLVPHLNGETYSHKPPLLFWLMQLSWWLLGVNDWSVRVISPLFSLAALLLSGAVAKALWPSRTKLPELTPFLLLGSALWMVYSTLTMFDMMLAFFVLLGIYSIIKLANTTLTIKNWLLLAIAIGGGVLTKGPVILLHLLPVALLAPWWRAARDDVFSWRRWYIGLFLSVLAGAGIALSWAIPAGLSGGEDYRNAIFLGQTSGRIVKSFAHRLPIYWYLELLPLLLLPWLFYKPLWQGFKNLSIADSGLRFCMAWAIPVFIAFSLVSGKRIHYLLPLLPALALVLARTVDGVSDSIKWQRAHVAIMAVLAIVAVVLMLLPALNTQFHWRAELSLVSPIWGGLLLIVVVILAVLKAQNAQQSLFYICIAVMTLLLTASSGFFAITATRYNTQPVAQQIANFMQENRPIAYFVGKYHGQFQFTGRLTKSITIIPDFNKLRVWAGQNPNGYVLVGYDDPNPELAALLAFSFPSKGQQIGLLSADKLASQPNLQKLLMP
jgi:4-amino-4-deoxy-L-arabinose transferase-like glycosyltransferase